MYKVKILGIGVVAALLLTSFVVAETDTELNKNVNREDVSLGAGVPTWEVGDSWTYKTDYWEGDKEGNMISSMAGEAVLEVVDDTGDSYLLTAEGRATDFAKENFNDPLDVLPLTVTAGLELKVRKDDLGLENFYQYSKGIGLITLMGIPLPIPVQFASEKTTIFDPTWVITPFPLVDGDTGVFDNVMFHEEWSGSLLWGLIPLYGGNNSWRPGNVEYTVTKESITCESGGYTAYNISGDWKYLFCHDCYRTYYVEEVGNTARENIHIEYTNGKVYLDFNMELASTTYKT
jgi:hypothetical protein